MKNSLSDLELILSFAAHGWHEGVAILVSVCTHADHGHSHDEHCENVELHRATRLRDH